MGLDMYLSAEKYVSDSDWRGEQDKFKALVELMEADKFVGGFVPNVQVQVSVAYWRKANQIHQWFVDNCGQGEDDCRPYFVQREQLEELLGVCKEVDADHSKASELLPTQGGFFFGGTEFDEWYFEGVKDTISQLETVLEEVPDDWSFYYQASW